MSGNIYIFNSLTDMKNASVERDFNLPFTMNENHYRRDIVTHKDRWSNGGHDMRTLSRDDFDEAFVMRRENIKRWEKKYQERHPEQKTFDDLRKCSLWLDYNHEHMQGYHDVDTDTKYCPLHLDNENPYLYEGIELEITFDDTIVDGYTGDRFDECGEYDEYGDYDDEGNYIPDFYEFDVGKIAREFMRITKGLFTCEEDGSLYQGYSFEAVSRPLSPMAWHHPTIVKLLEDGFEYLKNEGALIEQPSGNGFHIHISKKFFGANPACNRAQSEVAKDLNWVFQKFQNEIELIGGREYNQWCDSAVNMAKARLANGYGIVIEKAHLEKSSLDVPYGDHHRAFIDSSSGNTYEARVFHSTLDVNRVLACLEFMRNISHGARENALDGKTFGQILRYKNAPNLLSVVKRIKDEKKKLSLGKRNTSVIAL